MKDYIQLSREKELVPDDKFDEHMKRARINDIDCRKEIFSNQAEDATKRLQSYKKHTNLYLLSIMNIKIKTLTLTNFKCFRSKELVFNDDITVIRGRNGVGKTTIADAILWCLFGKNTQGQSDFDLKTHDAEGRPIPNLDHSVEMTLAVVSDASPSEVTLRRTLKETWIKKRGSDEQVFKNNTTEYLIDGEVKTATDYKKYISELVSEDIFRAITNPSCFPSLKWQQQREFLSALAGDINVETVVGGERDLQTLSSELDGDIIAYRKHLSYQIRQIKDKLGKITVRLEEQNKALPEKLNWDKLGSEISVLKSEIDTLNSKLIQLKSGNGDDVRKEAIRKELNALYDALRKREEELYKPLNEQRVRHSNAIAEETRRFNQLLNDQRDLESAIRSFDTLTERCQETLTQCERDAEQIRKDWSENLSRSVLWNNYKPFCPTCGQPLPQDQLRERQQQAIERLNQSKADTKAILTDRANEVKALRSQAEEQIKDYAASKKEAEANLSNIKLEINECFARKQQLEKTVIPTIEQALSSDEQYLSTLRSIEQKKAELQTTVITSDEDKQQLSDLELQLKEADDKLSALNAQLATKSQYDKILSLIDGIMQEEKDLTAQLSELERKEDVAVRYQDRQNQILEERVNRHFKLVQWHMFRTVNNGGDPFQEPYCECYVDGVAYHDGLNQAARLNAGLDILNALCRHYQVSAPIIIDQSESTLNILETVGQQVRLCVADCDFQVF